MYEELTKRLQDFAAETRRDDDAEIAFDALEAIEKLEHKVFILEGDREGLIAQIPRWIPVSERLPESESGDTSKPVLVTDGDCMAIAELFNFELCEPYWSYTGIGDVTHWMPLPEPPKEE